MKISSIKILSDAEIDLEDGKNFYESLERGTEVIYTQAGKLIARRCTGRNSVTLHYCW